MLPRFSFNEPSPADRLLANACHLKFEVMRVHGRLVADFTICGQFGELFDEDEHGNVLPEVDALGAIRELLGQYEAAAAKGGGHE